ncbi:hypothetical protein F5Y12DRAFT_756055 [Xylaria sp. FL1777]|nr:hypothetical protein F5Y12DRAFT_756055 [Xylaria sp. FL1777]
MVHPALDMTTGSPGTQPSGHANHYKFGLSDELRQGTMELDETESDSSGGLERNKSEYKPAALRWPFLTALLATLIIALVFLSHAVNTLPLMENHAWYLSEVVEARGPDTASGITITNIRDTVTPLQNTRPLQIREADHTTTILVTSVTTVLQTCIATTTMVVTENYGHVGYQTVTTTDTQMITEKITETVTETVTETFKETSIGTIREIITESALPQPHQPSSSSKLSDDHDVKITTVTKWLIATLSSAPQEDFGNASDKTSSETHLLLIPS